MTTWSKKVFVGFIAIVAVFGLAHLYTNADTGSVLYNSTASNTDAWSSGIVITGITSTSAKIIVPLFSSNGETIMNYGISYVKGKSIASTIDNSEIKQVQFLKGDPKATVSGNTIVLLFDGLTANTEYHFVVIPINKEGTNLDPANEQVLTTLATDSVISANLTASGSSDMESANVTYEISGSQITLTWQPIATAEKFSFSSKEGTEKKYTSVGNELVSKGTYKFILGKKGLYSIKIIALDKTGTPTGAEKILSVKIDVVSIVPGKGTPATGAELNIVLMSTFLLMLVYVVYRFRTTK